MQFLILLLLAGFTRSSSPSGSGMLSYYHAVESAPDVGSNITIAVQRLKPVHRNKPNSNSESRSNFGGPCHTNHSYSFHNATVRNASASAATASSGFISSTSLPRPTDSRFPSQALFAPVQNSSVVANTCTLRSLMFAALFWVLLSLL
jgi:hypothetical protein